MTKKILVAAALAAALMAAPAQGRSTLAVSLVPDFSLPVTCPGFGLHVDSLAGRPLGTGQTCIRSSVGCEDFVPFCRETIHATLTLDLARGSLTMPLTLHEVLPSQSSFIQAGRGEVSGGTGIYAGARGPVAGGGAGSFDELGIFSGRIVYVAELR
jgi:hypothetical protein